MYQRTKTAQQPPRAEQTAREQFERENTLDNIENTLFDKFYHCFHLQNIHKSTVIHSLLFKL